MINELILPEGIIQLERLKKSITLSDDTYFALLGCDSDKLKTELKDYSLDIDENIQEFIPSTLNIFEELKTTDNSTFFLIDLYNKEKEYVRNLLFFRDFIADYTLKVIILIDKQNYEYIMSEAIDLYNIASFSYNFETFEIDIIKPDYSKVKELESEYKKRKNSLNKAQKVNFLFQIASEYYDLNEVDKSFKYFYEALSLAKKEKNLEFINKIKYNLALLNFRVGKYDICEKYLLEIYEYFKKDKIAFFEILNQLIALYSTVKNYDKFLEFCNELEKEAKIANNELFEYNAKIQKMLFYDFKEKDKKIENLEEIKSFLYEKKYLVLLSQILEYEAITYNNEKNFKKALNIYYETNKINIEFKHNLSIIEIYSRIGMTYLDLFDIEKAIIYLEWSYNKLSLNRKESVSYSLAICYMYLNDIKTALQFAHDSLKISKKLNDKKSISNKYILISNIYIFYKQYDKSFKALEQAKNIIGEENSIEENIRLFGSYTNYYIETSNEKLAKEYLDNLKKLESDKPFEENAFLLELEGEYSTLFKEYEKANENFIKALNLAKEKDDIARIISIEFNIGKNFKKQNDKLKAKKYFLIVLKKLQKLNPKDRRIQEIEEFLSTL